MDIRKERLELQDIGITRLLEYTVRVHSLPNTSEVIKWWMTVNWNRNERGRKEMH